MRFGNGKKDGFSREDAIGVVDLDGAVVDVEPEGQFDGSGLFAQFAPKAFGGQASSRARA